MARRRSRLRGQWAAAVAIVLVVAGAVIWRSVVERRAATNADPPMTTSPTALTANATVLHHVDGDTIDVLIDGQRERVRLIGVDTPETKKEGVPVQCYGPQASTFTALVLPQQTAVYLERDTVGRDDYGRLLAYVYRANDGIFVNRELLRGGYARSLDIAPNLAHADEFGAAAAAARRDRLGLWGACPAAP